MEVRSEKVHRCYRFAFNGKENDDEVHGATGTFQDYGMRAYDPRIGRFPSVDPLTSKFAYLSPYQFAGNKPIWCYDLDGLEDVVYWRDKYYEHGSKRVIIRKATWSELYPGEEQGPWGAGEVWHNTSRAANGRTTAANSQFRSPDPDLSFHFELNVDLSFMGGSWGTGGGGWMREKGLDGAAADLTALLWLSKAMLNKMQNNGKFQIPKYKPGRQDEIPEDLEQQLPFRKWEKLNYQTSEASDEGSGNDSIDITYDEDFIEIHDRGYVSGVRQVKTGGLKEDTVGGTFKGNKHTRVHK